MSLPQARYGIDALYLFPVFQTREVYANMVGEEAPAFDPDRPPKHWFDPGAAESSRRSVVYDSVLAVNTATGKPIVEKGAPVLDVLVLSKDEAATVNIPPVGTNIPGANVPSVPVPLRPLDVNEKLAFSASPMGGIVEVQNTDFQAEVPVADGFTAADRALIQKIANKLGV
jgi:hypothetical protein